MPAQPLASRKAILWSRYKTGPYGICMSSAANMVAVAELESK